MAPEPAVHPAAGAAGGHGATEAEGPRVAQQGFDARHQRLTLAPPRGRFLDLGEHGLAVEAAADERVEVREGVEALVGPERVLPLAEADGAAAATVGRAPRLEDGRLGVDDQPVEVEDDGGEPRSQEARPQARAAAIWATRALIRS